MEIKSIVFILLLTCITGTVTYAYTDDALHYEDLLVKLGKKEKLEPSKMYTVVEGDNLYRIALKNDITLDELMSWNALANVTIYPGDQLVVSGDEKPVKPVEDVAVKVVKTVDVTKNIEPTKETEPVAVAKNTEATKEVKTINVTKNIESTKETEPVAVAKNTEATKEVKAVNVTKNIEPTKVNEPVAVANPSPVPSEAMRELTVSATAYTAYCEGCSGTTAYGIDLRSNPDRKVIAVDPTVIPLGTKVWVEGYGEAIAGDIGSAIKGHKIDLFMPSYDNAIAWGRQTVKLKILN